MTPHRGLLGNGVLGKGLLAVLAVIVLDQLSKLWVFNTFMPGEAIEVTPFFNLVLVFNPGAAFSFLADHAVGCRGVTGRGGR